MELYINAQMQTNLLVVQKRMIEEIAKAGKDCMIVGRNADVLLADKEPFRIFVCAGMNARIQRCMERASQGEDISRKGVEQNIRQIDKACAKTRESLGGLIPVLYFCRANAGTLRRIARNLRDCKKELCHHRYLCSGHVWVG